MVPRDRNGCFRRGKIILICLFGIEELLVPLHTDQLGFALLTYSRLSQSWNNSISNSLNCQSPFAILSASLLLWLSGLLVFAVFNFSDCYIFLNPSRSALELYASLTVPLYWSSTSRLRTSVNANTDDIAIDWNAERVAANGIAADPVPGLGFLFPRRLRMPFVIGVCSESLLDGISCLKEAFCGRPW